MLDTFTKSSETNAVAKEICCKLSGYPWMSMDFTPEGEEANAMPTRIEAEDIF